MSSSQHSSSRGATVRAQTPLPATGHASVYGAPQAGQGQPRSHAAHSANPKSAKGSGAPKAVLVVLAVVAVVYLAGVAFFSGHFMPRTTLDGSDVSLRTPDDLASHLAADFSSYQLEVGGDGVSLTVGTQDIDYSLDAQAYYDSGLAQQSAWTWPVTSITGASLQSDLKQTFDEDKLASLVGAAVDAANASATQPQNASLSYDSSSKAFTVTPEQLGTAVDATSVLSEVENALSTMQSTLTLGDEALLRPALTADSDAMKAALDQANKVVAATQTLTANGTTVATVEADQIAGWVTVADDGTVSVDTDAIKSWTQGDLSTQLDTVGTTRTYTRADGKQVSVSGGTYGWNVDGAALAETLAANISAASAQTVEVPWKSQGAQWAQGTPDWGARYIDVDLAEQHARMYDESGSLIWESDFVSGNTSQGHPTPEGVYAINSYKGTNQTLLGLDENHDGQPDYKSHVDYWMPFIDNLVAFHDAPWRSRFGGTIYQTNGSHGCVNLPSSKAVDLYNITQVGDVVVVHS